MEPECRLDAIERALGKATVRRPGVLLYEGNCLQILHRAPAGFVDLTVTSPPYNIGKEYEGILPLDEYLAWCERWIEELHLKTKDHGAFWLNLGYVSMTDRAKAIPIPYLLWGRVPFYLVQEIVWNYGAGVAARHSFSPRNEKFLWYVKNADHYTFNLDDVRDSDVKYPNQKKNGKLKCNPLGKNPSDVWNFPKVTSGTDRASKERTAHPAQFPAAVVERIIKACSNQGDVVLDPFMGSGTVAEVGIANNRLVVGFEIREDYVRIAKQRIDAFLERKHERESQGALFTLEQGL